jgi:PPOX class probable F420-dependent enzyme
VIEGNAVPASARRLFESDRHATVVTVGPGGEPQVSLVWIELDGDELVFGVEERKARVRNVRRDPRVTVVVEDTDDGPSGLRQYLTVHGRAKVVGPAVEAEFTALMDRLSHRYLGTDYPFANRGSATAVIVRITPDRVGGVGPWLLP